MSQLIVIEGHEGQRRQLAEYLSQLEKNGCTLAGKFEAATFPSWRALFENAMTPGLFATGRQILVAEGCDALGPFPSDLGATLEGDDAESVIIATFTATGLTAALGKTDAKHAPSDSDATSSPKHDSADAAEPAEAKSPKGRVFTREVLALNKIVFVKGDGDIPPWKRRDWLIDLAKKNNWRIAPNAAQLLGESIESPEELRSELAKLAIFVGEREISVRDVQALSFDEGAGANLAFLDGVCQGKASVVARALEHLKRNSALLIVLTSIVNRLRPALITASFADTGSQSNALTAVGVKDANAYSVRMARSALTLYGPQAIKDFIMGALRLSWREKTALSEGWAGFELLLWDFLSRARAVRTRTSQPRTRRA